MYSVLQIVLRKVVSGFLYSRSEAVTTAIEKNPGKDPPAIVFFCSAGTLIQSGSILSCLEAEKSFLLFRGPGMRKCRRSKGLSIDTIHNPPPPLLFHFTVPLNIGI